ncbi:hypothetical protein [Candidatus Entotheonella palauensis]|uniref:Uncharacterized protein n=1 Tax=Candidatus Entotheonella gemina TaxID=1429439 RepID=W4MC81_9BACT|nr:hypothetical protein [Candidatus Entotheonella palauensis]ETX07780.1 MAG: hypothetical protein ETSY2_09225 [Candidatus Entotheonella gemina]
MALYWHPYLAELLRQDYGDRLIIEEELSLGDMPLRADLLLIRRHPNVALPFPFSLLGERTLVEYKSPDDAATHDDLVKLETYGLLYVQREGLASRQTLTLWLLASRFREPMSRADGAYLAEVQAVGRGVRLGSLDGFPTCLIDLTQLPIASEVLPLLLVSKGPQERALVAFLVEHFESYPRHLRWLQELHVQQLREVLAMKKLTAEQIGLDYEALLDLIGEERALDLIGKERALDLIGKERALDLIGKERALDLIGKERALDLIGEEQILERALSLIDKEQVLEELLRLQGEQWLREQLERRAQPPDAPESA